MEPRKLSLMVAVLLCVVGLSAPNAQAAAGVGFYLNAGGGSGEENATFETGVEYTQDTSTSHWGVGFALDTNVLTKTAVFNYRLNLGYEGMTTKVDDATGPPGNHEIDWSGGVLEQDFGFGGNVSERIRLWGGPCVRLSYHTGSDEFDNDFKVFGFGIGPVFGANFGVGPALAFTVRAGFLFDGYAGDWERNTGGPSMDFSMSETRGFVSAGMLFGGY